MTIRVPEWLEPMLSTAFFSSCRTHRDAARSERNMYCLDCNGDAFCYYCRSSKHKDHQVIQIRRSSYHDVVRVSEIQNELDITDVQTYVINSARVLFLNERPQPKNGKGSVSHICEICARSLLDQFRFCSLGCKLVGIKTNGNASFSLEDKDEVAMGRRNEGISRRFMSSSRDDEGSQYISPSMSMPPHFRARRRKGVPQRAPFGS